MKRARQPENSLICIDKGGRVGIIGGIGGAGVQFYPFDKDGNTGDAIIVAVEQLKQADKSQIPASRMLPDEQLMELGYLDDPSFKATPPPVPDAAPAKVVDTPAEKPKA